ncbi:MAG: cytochrome c [Pseudomonadota bacterium]|jgi:hypothetical protein
MKQSVSFVRRFAPVLLVASALVVSACNRPSAPYAAQGQGNPFTAPLPAGLQNTASILDLMLHPIDTHADELWEAVATVSTIEGTRDVYPQTDEEWAGLRQKAIVLAEASNLLVTQGRRVGHPGQKVEGPGESTDLTPEQAQAEIDKEPAAFAAFAAAMQGAARGLIDAIDQRSVEDYLTAGSHLQEACEGCHRKFWYPNSPLPPGL